MKFFYTFFLSFGVFAFYTTHQAKLGEIKDSFGLIPQFLKSFPSEGLDGAWDQMSSFQISKITSLSGLHKELIGLAVAAQIPCHYCIYFHKLAAKLNEGGNKEIKEALVIAAGARYWATIFNGLQINLREFKNEVNQIVEIQKKKAKGDFKNLDIVPIEIKDAESAYKDVEKELGFVPSFVKKMPKASFPGAWKILKGMDLNPNTALSGKIKSLISLGVSSQIPCKYCIYWDSEMAKLQGASDEEIAEAVEMAAITRFWSTWLNGMQFNEKKFKHQADKIFAHLKK